MTIDSQQQTVYALDSSDWAQGLYFVKVSSGSQTKTKQFLKMR